MSNHDNDKDKDDIVYPEGVTDKIAYRNYLTYKERLEQSQRFIEFPAIDPDLQIDCLWPEPTLKKKIAHLPQEAVEQVRASVTALRKLKGKMSSAKVQAFGIKKRGVHSMHETLLHPYRAELVELFGSYHTSQEVKQFIKARWGLDITLASVRHFRKKHIDKIKQRQEEHQRDYSSIRLSHKKSRLQEYSELYSHRKDHYYRTMSREDYKLLIATLEKIKREVEGDKLTVDGHIDINVQHTVDMHLYNEILKQIPIIDIVISRLAARQQINPQYLMARLHQSIYAKFSGFDVPDGETVYDQEVVYPSSAVYDMEQIKRRFGDIKREEKELKSYNDMEPENKKANLSKKDIMLAALKKRQEQLAARMERASEGIAGIEDAEIDEDQE